MANMYAGYQGASIIDDNIGLVYWNAQEQMYEKRSVTNKGNSLSNSLDGSDGGYSLPKDWFNDSYNAVTGKFGINNTWLIIAAIAVLGFIAFLIFRRK